jgi:hypothetical protein
LIQSTTDDELEDEASSELFILRHDANDFAVATTNTLTSGSLTFSKDFIKSSHISQLHFVMVSLLFFPSVETYTAKQVVRLHI